MRNTRLAQAKQYITEKAGVHFLHTIQSSIESPTPQRLNNIEKVIKEISPLPPPKWLMIDKE